MRDFNIYILIKRRGHSRARHHTWLAIHVSLLGATRSSLHWIAAHWHHVLPVLVLGLRIHVLLVLILRRSWHSLLVLHWIWWHVWPLKYLISSQGSYHILLTLAGIHRPKLLRLANLRNRFPCDLGVPLVDEVLELLYWCILEGSGCLRIRYRDIFQVVLLHIIISNWQENFSGKLTSYKIFNFATKFTFEARSVNEMTEFTSSATLGSMVILARDGPIVSDLYDLRLHLDRWV